MTDFSRRTFVTSVVGALGVVGAASAIPTSASAAETGTVTPRVSNLEAFVRVAGVAGDATAAAYREWIPVTGWSWGTDGTGAAPLTFLAVNGRHTAALLAKAFAAAPLSEIVLSASLTGRQAAEVLTLTLKNAVVAQATSESGRPTTQEMWSVPSFSRADLRMRSVTARGQLAPWESMTWPAS